MGLTVVRLIAPLILIILLEVAAKPQFVRGRSPRDRGPPEPREKGPVQINGRMRSLPWLLREEDLTGRKVGVGASDPRKKGPVKIKDARMMLDAKRSRSWPPDRNRKSNGRSFCKSIECRPCSGFHNSIYYMKKGNIYNANYDFLETKWCPKIRNAKEYIKLAFESKVDKTFVCRFIQQLNYKFDVEGAVDSSQLMYNEFQTQASKDGDSKCVFPLPQQFGIVTPPPPTAE